MPKAILSENFSTTRVDKENGVIYGTRIMEPGKIAKFTDAEGKARSFTITPELISGLLKHAEGRDIPAHLSHDYSDPATAMGKQDRIHALLGVHKNLRVDAATGNLVSDLHTMPNEAGRGAMWVAENSPTNACLSAVFGYNPIQDGNRTVAVPLDFQAADLVAKGAATTALLSATQNDTDMTKEETEALLDSKLDAKLAPITAALAALKPAPATAAPGLTKEDVQAMLAEHKPKLSDEEKATLAEEAKAAVVAKLGTTGFQFNETVKKEGDVYTAKLTEYRKTSKTEGEAVSRLLKHHPELTHAREENIRAQLVNA